MTFAFAILGLVLGLFVGMLVLMEVGRRMGLRRRQRDPESVRAGVAAAEGAVFALLGLLIAFTFSGAASRFQERRRLITDESNAIGTAWMRLDLLPAHVQPIARENMRGYVDARLDLYRAIPDPAAMKRASDFVSTRQAELWRVVIEARSSGVQGWEVVLLPALNEMFDIGATRTHAMTWHHPTIVLVLLFSLALACAWLAGVAMAGASRRPTAHMVAFAAVVAATVYIIIDMEYPRLGFVRVDGSDQILLDVRSSMR